FRRTSGLEKWLFITQCSHGMKQGGPQRGQNAENHGNGNCSQVDEQDAGWIDESRNAVKVINVARKNVLARYTAQQLFDLVDVFCPPQPKARAEPGAYDTEQKPEPEKDLHDAAIGGA